MPDPERELSPEQEADVRRLLAEARATEPLPPDVASRLDRVLGDLGAERPLPVEPARETVAPAVRRRRASMLLAAAAAVVAVGVALGQVDRLAGNDDSGSGSTAADGGSSAERAPSAEDSGNAAGRSAAEDSAGGFATQDSSGRRRPASMARTPPPGAATPVGRIREAHFSADANQLRRALPPGAAAGFVELATDQLPARYVLTGHAYDCAPARWGAGALVPVVFEGTPAVLAYRPVIGDSQVVELLQCGTGETLRSTTLQAG